MSETRTLTHFILGLDPYVVIRPNIDDDGDLTLKFDGGGGVTERDIRSIMILGGRQFEETPAALAELLQEIVAADTDYETRYGLVLHAVSLAHAIGLNAGFGIDRSQGSEMDGFRTVAYIELPGRQQISWHMPEHGWPWDGHTTEEKFQRIAEFAAANGGESS